MRQEAFKLATPALPHGCLICSGKGGAQWWWAVRANVGQEQQGSSREACPQFLRRHVLPCASSSHSAVSRDQAVVTPKVAVGQPRGTAQVPIFGWVVMGWAWVAHSLWEGGAAMAWG